MKRALNSSVQISAVPFGTQLLLLGERGGGYSTPLIVDPLGGGNTRKLDMGFFEILAECSIALAGFGAVHAVLRGSTGARGVYRAWAVVSNGALSFALSILPLVLSLSSLSDELLWRMASTLGVAGAVAASYSSIALHFKMARLGHPPQATTSLRIGQTLSILSVLAMLLNVLGWPWPPGPLLYAVALVLILITGLNALLASFLLPLQLLLRGEDPESSNDPPAA